MGPLSTCSCSTCSESSPHCPPSIIYGPEYFFSRYPLEKSKLFNLKNLLTPGSWFAYFITIIFVIISLKLSCYVGVRLGLNTITEEIALVPFRFIKHIFLWNIPSGFQSWLSKMAKNDKMKLINETKSLSLSHHSWKEQFLA